MLWDTSASEILPIFMNKKKVRVVVAVNGLKFNREMREERNVATACIKTHAAIFLLTFHTKYK